MALSDSGKMIASDGNTVVKTIAADVLIQSQRDSEVSCLFRFLLHDRKAIPVTILYNVCKPQMDNVGDTQA